MLSVALNHPNCKLECTKSAPKKAFRTCKISAVCEAGTPQRPVNNQETDFRASNKSAQESHATSSRCAAVTFRPAAEVGQTNQYKHWRLSLLIRRDESTLIST